MEDRCQAETTKRKSALFQPIGGTHGRPDAVRYQQCKNRATTTVEVERTFLRTSSTRVLSVCSLHKKMIENGGYRP